MNFYEKEMRTMFAESDLIHDARFCGRTMLGKLDDELRVKLQLISTYVIDQYDAIQATIINRTEGVVDKQTFKFSDIIGKQQRGTMSRVNPHIWEDDGRARWYIPVTASEKEQIAETILDYVGMYQEEGMEMGGMNL